MAKKSETSDKTEQSGKKSSEPSGKHDVEREGWRAEELTKEASLDDADETKRQLVRGDKNERDIVGSVDFNETPEGKDERKVTRKQAEKTSTQNTA